MWFYVTRNVFLFRNLLYGSFIRAITSMCLGKELFVLEKYKPKEENLIKQFGIFSLFVSDPNSSLAERKT